MQVLGINFSIDAAAALVVDGRVVMAVQEERFTRVKHYAGFPRAAVNACLDAGGLRIDDLDAVAFFWNPAVHATVPNWRMSTTPRHHLEFLFDLPNHILPMVDSGPPDVVEQVFHYTGRRLRIYYVTHHLAHAAAALFSSPFEEAAVLTVDGYGERDCTVIWNATGGTFERVWTQEFPNSLGSYYAAMTQYMGFRPNSGEGKLMGLASYGDPYRFREQFGKILRVYQDGYSLDLGLFQFYLERRTRYGYRLVQLLGEPRPPEGPILERHEDIAAAAQEALEEAMVALAKLARRLTGQRTLCMSGGVALNCVANSRIMREAGFERYYFQPASSDAGSALGAALFVEHVIFGTPREPAMFLDYLGPEFTVREIERELEKGGLQAERPDDPAEEVANLLAQGRVGGVFQGKAEFGPRALGNRSILADPGPAEMKDHLNARVKFREPFRPYAPSILAEYAPEYFEGCRSSPFMLQVHRTRPEHLEHARAVTHVDGGARVQTVSREQNPLYHDIIDAFRKRTGVPLVLNTSFNIRGEPMVNSPSDALKCYLTTGLDFLLIGPFLLVKR